MISAILYLTFYSFIIPINNNINNINNNNNINNINNIKKNRISYYPFMKFEEIDGDYDFDGNLINKTLHNEAFNNIENIEYDANKDMWIINLNNNYNESYNSDTNVNFNMEKEINTTNNDDNFPSFYKFLREREIKEINEKQEYFKKPKNNKTIFSKFIKEDSKNSEEFEPSSKDLKLLSSFSTVEWMKTWIYEMIHVPDYFPTFMYQDMFRMREFGQKNNSKHYFYIGYFPKDVDLKHGPYYIGAFKLVPSMREFRTYIIIQNPYYCVEKIYDNKKIIDFKKELFAMCKDSMVFFKFSNLKDTSDQRYFYSWLYEK